MATDKPGKFSILRNLTGGLSTRNTPLIVENNLEMAMRSPNMLNVETFKGGALSKRLGKTLQNTSPVAAGTILWAQQTAIALNINPEFYSPIAQGAYVAALQSVTAPSTASIYSVIFSLFFQQLTNQLTNLQAVIYTNSSGKPGTLIATSNIYSNAGSFPEFSNVNVTFTFPTTPALTNGTVYWFGVLCYNNTGNSQTNLFALGANTSGSGTLQTVDFVNFHYIGSANNELYYQIYSLSTGVNGLYDFIVSSTGSNHVMAADNGTLAYSSGGTSWTALTTGLGSGNTWGFATLMNFLISCDYGVNTPRLWNSTAAYTMQLGYRSSATVTPSATGGTIPGNQFYTIIIVTQLQSGGYRTSGPWHVSTYGLGGGNTNSITMSGLKLTGTGASDFGFDLVSGTSTIYMDINDYSLVGTSGIYTMYQLAAASVSVGNPVPDGTTTLTITAVPAGTENTLVENYSQPQQYFTNQVSAPNAQFMCVFNNMLIANDINNPCRIWTSQLEAPQIWGTYGGITGGYYDLDLNDGEFITGIGVWNGYLYVFKRHTAWIGTYTSIASSPISFRKLPTTFGCLSHWTIKDLGANGLYRLTDGGPRVFIGSYDQPAPGSAEILDRFNLAGPTCYNLTLMNEVTAALNPTKSQIWMNVAKNGCSTYNATLIYDYEKQIFWENDCSATAYAEVLDSNLIKHIWSSDYAGYVYQQDSGLDDNGTAINWYFYTPLLQLGDPYYKKTLLRVYVAGAVQSSGTLYCDVLLEGSSTPAQTLVFDMTNPNFISGDMMKCGQRAKMFQLCFRNNVLDVPVEIDAIGLDWVQETREY